MAEATKEPVLPPSPESILAKIVELWFMDNFHNTVGWDTATYNRFYSAKEELKAKLTAAVKEG